RSVTWLAFNSSPIMDLTGYRQSDTTEPTTLPVSLAMFRLPSGASHKALSAGCKGNSQVPAWHPRTVIQLTREASPVQGVGTAEDGTRSGTASRRPFAAFSYAHDPAIAMA